MVVPVACPADFRTQAERCLALHEPCSGFDQPSAGQQAFAPVSLAVPPAGRIVFLREIKRRSHPGAGQHLNGLPLKRVDGGDRAALIDPPRQNVEGAQQILSTAQREDSGLVQVERVGRVAFALRPIDWHGVVFVVATRRNRIGRRHERSECRPEIRRSAAVRLCVGNKRRHVGNAVAEPL